MYHMGKYPVILIDPPWTFRVWNKETGNKRSPESHYPTLTLETLKALPIQNLMTDDCAVFMWSTWPTLPDALSLAHAWGLIYKTCAFNWLKRTVTGKAWHVGMGYWTRANSEPCLLFTRGSPKRINKGVQQLIYTDETQLELFPPLVARIGNHSAKPEIVYHRIEKLMNGPYLEIFARNRRSGWDSIGNEIDGQDIRDTLKDTTS